MRAASSAGSLPTLFQRTKSSWSCASWAWRSLTISAKRRARCGAPERIGCNAALGVSRATTLPLAVTVALRTSPVSSDISPATSSGPSSATLWSPPGPRTETMTLPETMVNMEAPGSPWRISTAPRGNTTRRDAACSASMAVASRTASKNRVPANSRSSLIGIPPVGLTVLGSGRPVKRALLRRPGGTIGSASRLPANR